MKILDYKKLTDSAWLNLYDVAYVDKKGHQRSWQVVSRHQEPKCISGRFDMPDAVLMIPFHKKEKSLVVLKEYRVSLASSQYEFPAGLIDPKESIEEAAKRELMEETGLTLTRITQASPPLYNTAGLTDESVALVFCECEGVPSTKQNQGTEFIEVCLLSPQEANQILRDKNAQFDVKLWMELKHFASQI